MHDCLHFVIGLLIDYFFILHLFLLRGHLLLFLVSFIINLIILLIIVIFFRIITLGLLFYLLNVLIILFRG